MPCDILYNKLRGNLSMEAAELVHLVRKFRHALPEICFLQDLWDSALDAVLAGDLKRPIGVRHFTWRGERSGHAAERVLPQVIAKLRGQAEVLLVCQSGNMTVLNLQDGNCSEWEASWSASEKQISQKI